MAIKNITFDPTSGVPYASNLTIQGGGQYDGGDQERQPESFDGPSAS